jgi:hypothetical protein
MSESSCADPHEAPLRDQPALGWSGYLNVSVVRFSRRLNVV